MLDVVQALGPFFVGEALGISVEVVAKDGVHE